MGGNALGVPPQRLPAAQYQALGQQIMPVIADCIPGQRLALIPAYGPKADFGDMALLLSQGEGDPVPAVATALQARHLSRNGPVASLGLAIPEGIFQVDLISVPPEQFDFALRYFAFNDLGNLIGRVAHQYGLKFGHQGLVYPLRAPDSPTNLLTDLMVTTDFDTALRFLGYDPAQYQAGFSGGFQALEDVFAFVASTPHFRPEIYLLENRSHVSRTRDRKRKAYQAFLSWVATQAFPAKPKPDKAAFLEQLFVDLPAFKQTYQDALQQHARHQDFCARFNGQLVGQWTGLQGKALGHFMQQFVADFGGRDPLIEWVLSNQPEVLQQRVQAFQMEYGLSVDGAAAPVYPAP